MSIRRANDIVLRSTSWKYHEDDWPYSILLGVESLMSELNSAVNDKKLREQWYFEGCESSATCKYTSWSIVCAGDKQLECCQSNVVLCLECLWPYWIPSLSSVSFVSMDLQKAIFWHELKWKSEWSCCKENIFLWRRGQQKVSNIIGAVFNKYI